MGKTEKVARALETGKEYFPDWARQQSWDQVCDSSDLNPRQCSHLKSRLGIDFFERPGSRFIPVQNQSVEVEETPIRATVPLLTDDGREFYANMMCLSRSVIQEAKVPEEDNLFFSGQNYVQILTTLECQSDLFELVSQRILDRCYSTTKLIQRGMTGYSDGESGYYILEQTPLDHEQSCENDRQIPKIVPQQPYMGPI